MISCMISYIYYRLPTLTACAALPLQRPIFPWYRALMQAKAAMIRTEKSIKTRPFMKISDVKAAESGRSLAADSD